MSATSLKPWSHIVYRLLVSLVGLSVILSVFAGCAPNTPASPNSAPTAQAAKPTEIKIAILPIIDALPLYVATKQGYFTANNVNVSFIPVASAAERDQLIASGQADGMINDLVSVALYNKQAVQVQTVSFARSADLKTAMYRVLAAKDSGLNTAAGLAGVPVGMSQGTVIDYVTSRLLEREGLKLEQIKSLAVPKLPDRLALLGKGELKAATLPEPFGTIAQQAGAVLIVDDAKYPEYGYSVLSLRKASIDQHPEAVKGFLAAINKAADEINKNPETYRPLLAEYKMVPASIQATYPIPPFQAVSIPSEAQWKDVIAWMKTRQLLDKDLPYA